MQRTQGPKDNVNFDKKNDDKVTCVSFPKIFQSNIPEGMNKALCMT